MEYAMWSIDVSSKPSKFSWNFRVLAITSLLLLLAGCIPGEEPKDSCDPDKGKVGANCPKDPGTAPGEGGNPTPPPPGPYAFPDLPGRVCTIDRFQQLGGGQQEVKKVDILFVMDHSGSMADDWGRVASNISHMVRELPTNTHIRYAVVLGDIGNWRGRLYAPTGMKAVLDSQKSSVQEISRDLHKMFTEAMKVNDPGTGEALFHSLFHAVTTNARANQQLGFFRADAALSILFMSDEHEIGFPFPSRQALKAQGLPYRCDENVEEVHKRDSYDRPGINMAGTYNAVKALKGDMPVKTHAFVNITKEDLFKRNSKNASCLYDSLGYGYFEMVEKTKGVLFSIQEDRAKGMARCGEVIRESLELTKDFKLSQPAEFVDPATILAVVDKTLVPHEYQAGTNMVHLEQAGSLNSLIHIRHCKPDGRKAWNLTNFSGQAGQHAVALTWKTAEYATSGKVLYGTSATSLNQEVRSQSVTTNHVATAEGLNANTLYYFQAIASDEFGQEKRSDVISVRTLPDWGISGVAGQSSRNSASLNWKTTQYPTKGRVKWGASANALVNETAETAAATEHNVVVNGLSPNTVYYFQCLSRDEFGLEKAGDVLPLQTQVDWGIVNFAGQAARTSVQLNWSTPEHATLGKILWGTSSTALTNQLVGTSAATNHSATIESLSPNTTYYFQAVNRDEFGLEKRSNVISVRTLVDWNISEFSGTSTETAVAVGWKTSEYNTSGALFWGLTAETLNQRVNSATVGTEHRVGVTGLTEDTVYYFQAQSRDEFGLEKRSQVVAIRTKAKEIPPPPPLPVWELTEFSGQSTTSSVAVGWKTAEYATSGKVLFGTSADNLDSEQAESVVDTIHALTISGLRSDTLYYFQAVSKDDFGQEKRSAVVAIRTQEDSTPEPPPVENWEVRGFDGTTTPYSADLIWQTPGAFTKATVKVGLSPDDLSLQILQVTDYAETQLLPVNGLSPDTNYYFQVIAVDRNGRTVESVILSKKTKSP